MKKEYFSFRIFVHPFDFDFLDGNFMLSLVSNSNVDIMTVPLCR